MTENPPAALLRLREADVLRLCGLDNAARGLELVDQRAVRQGRRRGGRIEAVVQDAGEVRVWWQPGAEDAPQAPAWRCERDAPPGDAAPAAGATSPLGCAHVAALLTAWIRSPADFPSPQGAENPPDRVVVRLQAPVTQPKLIEPARRPRANDPSLSGALERLSPADLTALARRVLSAEPEEREARRALAAFLGDPSRLAAHVERLDAGPRALLAAIALAGGVATAADLDGVAARAGEAPSAFRSRALTLERNGLVFPAPGAGGQAGGERSWREVAGWRIPPEVLAALPLTLPLDPLPARGPGGPPILAADGTQPRTARPFDGTPVALCRALALLARAPAPFNPLARSPAPAEAGERAAAFALVPGDLPHGALSSLARAAELPPALASMARRLLLWARASGLALDLAAVPPQAWPALLRLAFNLWRIADAPFELADLPLISGARAGFDPSHPTLRPAALASEIREARAFVLRVLATARTGAWYSIDGFLELVWRVDPLFLRRRQLPHERPGWWLEREGSRRPLRPTERDEWMAGEGAYLRALLAGPLHWWGLLDLASAGPDARPVAFRLTPFGGALLMPDDRPLSLPALARRDWGPAALPTRDGALSVQPLALREPALRLLDEWMGPTRIAAGRLIYAIDRDRAAAALDGGRSSEPLLAALCDLSGGARAADAVRRQIEGVRAGYEQSVVYDGWTLVEARDAPALEEALALVPAVRQRARRPAAHLALVTPADAAPLEAALRRRGYTV